MTQKNNGDMQVLEVLSPLGSSFAGRVVDVAPDARGFIEAVRSGGEAPSPLAKIFSVTEACFAAQESIRTGLTVRCLG